MTFRLLTIILFEILRFTSSIALAFLIREASAAARALQTITTAHNEAKSLEIKRFPKDIFSFNSSWLKSLGRKQQVQGKDNLRPIATRGRPGACLASTRLAL